MYQICILFVYVMDFWNDVMLVYEMNDLLLLFDYGYLVRVMILGYVGGCCVKWLKRVWILDKENESYYYIWDNCVFLFFIIDMESFFVKIMFRYFGMVCNEQVLNLVIVRLE